jgi:1-aminocyclopropane-1-carboxylate deaminase/D-cysteine desulfhydrase-like pyridoxal-dependent ACC family enzyme
VDTRIDALAVKGDVMDFADFTRKIRTALEPCSLGRWPTALDAATPGLWIKREDRSSDVYGGNKVRGLEFLLAHVPSDAALVTVGGWGSTHCLATVVHAHRLGYRVALAQFPQGRSDAAVAVADACGRLADFCLRAKSWPSFPFALAGAWRRAKALGSRRWIPGGGARADAVVGHLLGGLELASQLPSAPEAIVTPLGSGGTAAGLLLAVAALGWRTRIVGVRVAPAIVANRFRVRSLARAAQRLLRRHGIVAPIPDADALVVLDGLGDGYGHPTAAGEAARERARAFGLALDSTYGGKAFAALTHPAVHGRGPIVFWNTFAAAGSGLAG